MAAILGGQLAQECRPPERCEARAVGQRRNAAELGGDEHGSAVVVDGDVVDVQVAGGVRYLGHIEPVVPLVKLAAPQKVLETPELIASAEPQGLAVGP